MEVAEILHISARTVNEYARSAFRKLGAANRTQAVAIASATVSLPCSWLGNATWSMSNAASQNKSISLTACAPRRLRLVEGVGHPAIRTMRRRAQPTRSPHQRCQDDVGFQADQLPREPSYQIDVTAAPPKVHPRVATNGPTQARKGLRERREVSLRHGIVFVARDEPADPSDAPALLRARRSEGFAPLRICPT
jgi:hypothetical protein